MFQSLSIRLPKEYSAATGLTLSFSHSLFRFPSVICTMYTGFFSLAIIKGLLMIFYFIIEDRSIHYLQKKFHTLIPSYSRTHKTLKVLKILAFRNN